MSAGSGHPGYPAPQGNPGYPAGQYPGPGYPPTNNASPHRGPAPAQPGYPPQPAGYPPQSGGYPQHGQPQGGPGYPSHYNQGQHHGAPHAHPQGASSSPSQQEPAVHPQDVNPTTTPGGSARTEHVRKSAWCSSLDVIQEEHGRGMLIYFHYLRFLTVACMAMSIFSLGGWAVAGYEGLLQAEKGEESTVHDFLLSSYPKNASWAWYFATVCQIIIAFSIGPIWRSYQRIHQARWADPDTRTLADRDDKIRITDKHGAVIETSPKQRALRRYASAFLFLCIVTLQGTGTWFLHKALADQSNTTVAQIIALCISVLNACYKVVSKKMTTFERHQTWKSYREWDCGKLFVLKMLNLIVLYVVKQETARLNILEQSFCPIAAAGTQFFWLIVTDVTLNNAMEMLSPVLLYLFKKHRSKRSGHGDMFAKMDFDLADEYVEVFYRQFIIILGMTVFPAITALGAVAYIIEYLLDKFRLVYLCRVKLFREEPLTENLVLAASIAVSFLALVSFPNGAVWVMSGENMSQCNFFK